ncbi:MAG: hypothetical protein AAFN94_17685 [Pseudomonadota bacterium]
MNDLSPDLVSDRSEPLDVPALRLGLVPREALDTMLKLERLPPPVLSYAKSTQGPRGAPAYGTDPQANTRRLQAAKMQLDLAQLVLAREDDIVATGDPDVIAGLNEVNRFLLHSAHLRLLQES